MGDVILQNCRLIDGISNQVKEDQQIVIAGGKINRIEPVGSSCNGNVVDMKGMYVLAGLWDMHVHLGMRTMKSVRELSDTPEDTMFCYRRALAFMEAGVTSLRLVGSAADGIDFALRDGINSGEYVGPRILTAGVGIASTGGHGYRGDGGCDGPYEFRKAARRQLWLGADLIKVMVTGGMGGKYEGFQESQTLRDEVAAAIEVAHNAGKHVAAHVASPDAAVMCAEVGLDTVEHGYALDERALEVMDRCGTAFVPTLVVTCDPDYWERLGVVSWAMSKIREAGPSHRRAAELAVQMGAKLAIGTDLPTACMDGTIVTVREMELFEELGANPMDVIRWATAVPAELCGEDCAGVIAPGKVADVIAVENNPLDTVSNLRQVSFVMVRGRIVKDQVTGHVPIGLPPGFLSGPC